MLGKLFSSIGGFSLKIEHNIQGAPTFLGLKWMHRGRFNGLLFDPPLSVSEKDTATEDIWEARNNDGTHQLRYYIRTTWLRHASITRYSWVYYSPVLKRDFVWNGVDLPETFPWKDFIQ